MQKNFEQVIWRNPYSNATEELSCRELIDPLSGEAKIPTSFSDYRYLIDRALNGLVDCYNKGSVDGAVTLAYVLTDLLDEPKSYTSRKISKKLLSSSMKNIDAFIEQVECGNPELLLAEEINMLLTDGKQRSSDLSILPEELPSIIVSAYLNSFGSDQIEDRNRQIRFRRRLNDKFCDLRLTDEQRKNLRLQSATYYGVFYDRIARRFRSAVGKRLLRNRLRVYRLLHQSHKVSKGFGGAIQKIPPVSSLPQFNDLRFIYAQHFGNNPLVELADILEDKKGRIVRLPKFIRKIVGLLRWYRVDYLIEARQNDGNLTRRATRPGFRNKGSEPKLGSLAKIDSDFRWSAKPNIKTSASLISLDHAFLKEEISSDASDIPGPMLEVSNALEQKGIEHRKNKLGDAALAFGDEATFRDAILRLTSKQQEVFNLYFNEGQSTHAISAFLGISVPSVRERIDGSIKKLIKISKK